MTYRVELNDEVAVEVARFGRTLRGAWNACINEIARDPWERQGDGFEIEESRDQPPDEPSSIVFTAQWISAAIVYFAKQYALDDGIPDPENEGVVRIFKLVWA